MFLLVPIGTDAPIYHWPYATVGLIIATFLAFIGQETLLVDAELSPGMEFSVAFDGAAEEGEADESELATPTLGWNALQRWMLATGDGIHPLQWVTHLFMHADWFHLIGNLMFLWAFGLIVEGKVGPLVMLGLYFGVGILEGIAIQLALLWTEPSFLLGASGAIFGLLAICLIWAPANEFQCFYFFLFGFRISTGVKEIAVVWFAVLYFFLNILGFLVSLMLHEGLSLSSELAHLTGGLFGLGAGVAMLKASLVDCEGWDAFTRFRKHAEHKAALWRGGEPPKKRRRSDSSTQKSRREADPSLSDTRKEADAQVRVARMIEQGMAAPALAAYCKAKQNIPAWRLDEPEHLKLIKLLHDSKEFSDSIPIMRDYVNQNPQKALRVKIRMAQVLVRELNRPTAAIRVLNELPSDPLPGELEAVRTKLRSQAQALIDEGVLEVEGDH
jgi:membrane associated rhomboid family serine protease